MLSEEKAYAKADQLITSNNQSEILNILSKNAENYKNVGTLLGENFKEGLLAQIQEAKNALDSLTGTGTSNSSSGSNSNSSTKTDTSGVSGKINLNDIDEGKYYKGTTTSGNKYKVDSKGKVIFDWGTLTDKELSDIKSRIARFASGGRVGDLGADGKFVTVDSNEMIANADDTKKFDEMYNYIKNSGTLLTQLSNQYANPNNYSLPNLVGTNLNEIASNVTNTNSNSTTTNSISMPVTIVNEKGAEQFTEQKLYKAMDKWQKEQNRRYK